MRQNPLRALLALGPVLAAMACSPTPAEPPEPSPAPTETPAQPLLPPPPFVGVEELWGNEQMGPWRNGRFLAVNGSLVEAWSNGGALSLRQFQVASGADNLWRGLLWEGHLPEGFPTLPEKELLVVGDSLVQWWNASGQVGMMQYRMAPGGIGFNYVWANSTMGEPYDGTLVVIGSTLVQVRSVNGLTTTRTYTRDADGSGFTPHPRQTHTTSAGTEYRAIGNTLVQLRNISGNVAIDQFSLRQDGSGLDLVWSEADTARPWGNEFHVIGEDLLQLRNNNGRLAMVRYAPLVPGPGFTAKPEQLDVGSGFWPGSYVVVGSTLVQWWSNGSYLGLISHTREATAEQYTIHPGIDMFEPPGGSFIALGNTLVQAFPLGGQLTLVQYGHPSCLDAPYLRKFGYFDYYHTYQVAPSEPDLKLTPQQGHSNLVSIHFPNPDAPTGLESPENMLASLRSTNMKGFVFLWTAPGLEDTNGKLVTACSEKSTWLPLWDALAARLRPYEDVIGAFYFEEMYWRHLYKLYKNTTPTAAQLNAHILDTNERLRCLLDEVRADFPGIPVYLAEDPATFLGDYVWPWNYICPTCVQNIRIPDTVDAVGTYFYLEAPYDPRPTTESQFIRDFRRLGNKLKAPCQDVFPTSFACRETVGAHELSDAMQRKLLRPYFDARGPQRLFAIPSANLHAENSAADPLQLSRSKRAVLNRLYAMAAVNPIYEGILPYYWTAGSGTTIEPKSLGALPLDNPLRARFREVGQCILAGPAQP